MSKENDDVRSAENIDNYRENDSRLSRLVFQIVALLAAFGLWLYVGLANDPTFEMTFTSVPVRIEGAESAGLSVLSGYSNTVDVTLQGKRSEVMALTNDDIRAYADVSGITETGRYEPDVHIEVPSGMLVTSKSLSVVPVYMDRTTTITVPVRAQYASYTLSDGYELGDPSVNISEVKVTGPVSELEDVQYALVPLQLGSISNSVTVMQEMQLVKENGEIVNNVYVKMAQTTAKVTVPVYMTKTIPLQVDCKYGYYTPESTRIEILPASVTVRGEVGVMQSLYAIKLLTLDETKTDGSSITQKITLPEGVTNLSGEETATVKITHLTTSTATLTVKNFDVNNPNKLPYTLLTDSVTITLRGDEKSLRNLWSEDYVLRVDMSYLTNAEGTVTLPAEVRIGYVGGKLLYPIGEYYVTVRIGETTEL